MAKVVLTWERLDTFRLARRRFRRVPCIYILDRHVQHLAYRLVLELQGHRPGGLGRLLVGSLALLALDTVDRRGPLAGELLLHEPWVGDCTRIPGASWTGPEDAREGRPVLALRAEPQACACLAA